MTSKIFTFDIDISTLFNSYSTGNKVQNTNIITNSNDIANIYEKYSTGEKIGYTNIYSGVTDIANLFQAITPYPRKSFNISFASTSGTNVSLLFLNGFLYCCGKMTAVVYNGVSTTASLIGRWDRFKQTWSSLATFTGNLSSNAIQVIWPDPDGVSFYIGGSFLSVVPIGSSAIPSTQNIAKYNTQTNTWSSVAGGFGGNPQAFQIKILNNVLYAIRQNDGLYKVVNNIWAKRDITFYSTTSGTGGATVQSIVPAPNGKMILSGNFATLRNAGGALIRVNFLAIYDPDTDTCSTFPNTNNSANGSVGVLGSSNNMIIINNVLYLGANANVGNSFFSAYDFSTGIWSAPNVGVTGVLFGLYHYNGILYVGFRNSVYARAYNISTNTATTITLRNPLIGTNLQVTSFAIDPSAYNTIYIGTGSNVTTNA